MIDYFIFGILAGIFVPPIISFFVYQVKTILAVRRIKRGIKADDGRLKKLT